MIWCSGAIAQVEPHTVLPSQAQEMIDQLTDEKLTEYISPQVTEVIAWYTTLNDEQVADLSDHGPEATPAAALAGAAAGAAIAVYEFARDKVVGRDWREVIISKDTDFDLGAQNNGRALATPAAVAGAISAAVARDVVRALIGQLSKAESPVYPSTDYDLK